MSNETYLRLTEVYDEATQGWHEQYQVAGMDGTVHKVLPHPPVLNDFQLLRGIGTHFNKAYFLVLTGSDQSGGSGFLAFNVSTDEWEVIVADLNIPMSAFTSYGGGIRRNCGMKIVNSEPCFDFMFTVGLHQSNLFRLNLTTLAITHYPHHGWQTTAVSANWVANSYGRVSFLEGVEGQDATDWAAFNSHAGYEFSSDGTYLLLNTVQLN